MSQEKPFHESVADKLLAQLEAGTSVFQKLNTDSPQVPFQTPFNPQTNKAYRGINALALAMQDYTDPRWLTMRQANIIGAKVPKGAKGTPISFAKEIEGVATPQKAWVFNGEQLTNMPSLKESLEKLQEQKAAAASEKKPEEMSIGAVHELKQKGAGAEPMVENLVRGEQVAYNSTTYKITDVLKKGLVKIEDLGTGEKTKISIEDGLYKSLLQAKYHPDLAYSLGNGQGKANTVSAGAEATVIPSLNVPEELSQRSGVRR